MGFNDAINSATNNIKNGSIIDTAYREYIICLDFYPNEQHSEFLAIHYGKHDGEYDKTVYRKLEKLYRSIHNIGRTASHNG